MAILKSAMKNLYDPCFGGNQVEALKMCPFSGTRRICGDHGRVRFRKTTLLIVLAALDRPTAGRSA